MAVARGSLTDYEQVAGEMALERLRAAAGPLAGLRVAHVSAARGGAQVARGLSSLLPLAADAGLEVSWSVLFGDVEAPGRALADGLQGAEMALDDAAWDAHLDDCGAVASALEEVDLVVLHDPAVLGLAAALEAPVVWRCHLDASEPDEAALELALPLVERCASVAFADESLAPPALRERRVARLPPGIDPLSPRNLELAPRLAGRVVRPLGVDLARPFACQAMRLDRWGDPHAAIEAFELARDELAGLQLVLALQLQAGDTVEWRAAKEVSDYAAGSDGLVLVTSHAGLGDLELAGLQRLARAVLHLALREGSSPPPAEALWKGTPVVGNPKLGVRDGREGYLVERPEEAAARLLELVADPGLAVALGRTGRERVRESGLVTHTLEHGLRLVAATLERS